MSTQEHFLKRICLRTQEPKGAPDTELSQGFQTSHTESDIHD